MTNQNRITLKNIKYAEFASEETHCYEASVYFDGKRVGTVSNDGHGGADYQYPTNDDQWAAMLAYIDTLPARPCEWSDDEYPESLESICCDLVTNFLYERDAKKLTRGKVSFFDGEFNGTYRYVKIPRGMSEQETVERIRKQRPHSTIINTLPMSERVALLRGALR